MKEMSVREVFDILLSAQPGLYDEMICDIRKNSEKTRAYKLMDGYLIEFRIDDSLFYLLCDTGGLDMEDIYMLAEVYFPYRIPFYTVYAEKIETEGDGFYIFSGTGKPYSDERVTVADESISPDVIKYIYDYCDDEKIDSLEQDGTALYAVYDDGNIIGAAAVVPVEENVVSLNVFISDECIEKELDVCLVRSAMSAYPDALYSCTASFSDRVAGTAERAGLRIAGTLFTSNRHMFKEIKPDGILIK